jgi:hypothetical protein
MKIMCTVGVVILYDYMFCAHKVPSRESEKDKQLGRSMRRWKVNNKIDHNKTWWKGVD